MASNSQGGVQEALVLIENAGLSHPSGPLLSSFVTEALSPRLAAQHVLWTCQTSPDREADLLSLVSDWAYIVESFSLHGSPAPAPDASTQLAITKRDGFKCCITGKAGHFWDPLVVVPILPVPSNLTEPEPRIFDMLGAFFTPPYRDWWLSHTRNPGDMSPYYTHWLVRKSAADAFSRGLLRLNRIQPSMIEYEVQPISIGSLANPIDLDGSYPLLGDHSRSGTKKVDARFVGTHARLAPSIRWLDVAKYASLNKRIGPPPTTVLANQQITNRQFGQSHGFSLMEFFNSICLAAWRTVPARARIATYRLLQKVGRRIYGAPGPFCLVQRLPFGLYLKYLGDPDGLHNEFNAIQMVRQYTSIPVPRPLDIVSKPTESEDGLYSRDAYLLTTRIPGVPLSYCREMLSDEDAADFVAQMQDYLTQLRAIPKAVSPEYAICNTLGGPCRDTRIQGGNPVGPFVDEASFSQLLRNPDEPSRRGHKIVFTHADLNSRNILVDQVTRPDGTRGWRVMGIVDWENSGYYPEYWDYTKALFEGFRYTQRWRNVMHETFRAFGDFSKEFEVEKRSWEEGDYV
ncbi:hypothetical protein GGS23DRAFT_590615 [Durotheca rogersii]|uniref:uncharacterized protein n=1 Tax=Durotheca rogersii TaxID=419775 RepID=UPI00221FDE07|nr:uncharacterized protein GGS23DRAFT_590615 [Durotheca rogersii]KAI5854495.1 hypothetical protein GGS23DRAFT_590615 [Durotheca rogersii]